MTHSRSGRRIAALVSGVGLAAASLLAAPVAPAAAAPPNDSDAAVAGGQWLADELGGDGLLENPQFPDFPEYGLTIDAGLTLDAFEGGQVDERLADVTDTLSTEESVDGYLGFGDPDETVAGAAGKLLSFLLTQDVDANDVDGVDLEARVAETVATQAPIAGRVENISEFADNANVLGQGFVARALTLAGNEQAGPTIDFLLLQQCSDGFFRNFFSGKDDADQSCDAATTDESLPSVDATALSVINLQATEPAAGTPTAEAIDLGIDWLLAEQSEDGSFVGAPPTDTPNTNSTGLAAQAFAGAGEDDAAEAAAEYVVDQQAGSCDGPLAADAGAVAYDGSAYDAGRSDGIPVELLDQWRRASGQAVTALRSLGEVNGSLEQATDARYVRAGSRIQLRATDLTAGTRSCLTGPRTDVRLGGAADRSVGVDVPLGTGARVYRLTSRFDQVDSVTLQALGAKRFDVRLAKRAVARGARQTVTLNGLAPREKVTVRLRGAVVDTGFATDGGFFRRSFVVTGRPGAAPVKVTGQFAASRFGTDRFTVR